MKFVFDKKTGQYMPESYLDRVDRSDIEKEVFTFLDRNPQLIAKYGYSSARLMQELIRRSPNYDVLMDNQDIVKAAMNEWYFKNQRKADEAFEEAGGACGPAAPAGAPATISALSIPSPVLPDKKKKKKSSKESGATEAAYDNYDDIPEEYKQGNCYQTAWQTFYHNIAKKPLLCHGVVVGKGRLEGVKFTHAWVEIGDEVIDETMPVSRFGIPKEVYYQLGKIDKKLVFRYDSAQVSQKAVEWGTYGPWEDILWQYG